MIAQVLNHAQLLKQAKLIHEELAQLYPGDSLRNGAPVDLAQVDLDEARAELGEYLSKPEPPEDPNIYIGRDPIASNLQTILELYYRELAPEEIVPTGLLDRSKLPAPYQAGTEYIRPSPDRLFEEFSQTDIGWIACLYAKFRQRRIAKHAFVPRAAEAHALSSRARLILVGDWGSGLPRAQMIARLMRREIDSGLAEQRDVHVIHLGDVYYSGWQTEYEQRFLACWPVRVDEAKTVGSWCLNANHDMFSGGHDYFDFLLRDPRFFRHHGSSEFVLASPEWTFLGLDTAWTENTLSADQVKWIAATRALNPDRRTALLSHHQYFSDFEKSTLEYPPSFHSHLEAHPLDVWFWGHEHRCAVYRENRNVRSAWCLGHGGVPVYTYFPPADLHPVSCVYQYRKALADQGTTWLRFGFAVVDLNGRALDVRLIDEENETHFTKSI